MKGRGGISINNDKGDDGRVTDRPLGLKISSEHLLGNLPEEEVNNSFVDPAKQPEL